MISLISLGEILNAVEGQETKLKTVGLRRKKKEEEVNENNDIIDVFNALIVDTIVFEDTKINHVSIYSCVETLGDTGDQGYVPPSP